MNSIAPLNSNDKDERVRMAAWDVLIFRDSATGGYLLLPPEPADAAFLAALGLSHAPIIATPVLVHFPSDDE